MEGITGRMDRLYELYLQHHSELRSDVTDVNRSLNSKHPEKTWMELLSRSEFELKVTSPTGDEERVQRWIRRLVHGFEHEFPELRVA